MSTIHAQPNPVKQETARERSMYFRSAANMLLREAAVYYQEGKGYHGDVHFHFHMKPDGTTHTSSSPFSETEMADMKIASLEERNEHLEARIAELEAVIPDAEIIAREYHANP